MADGGDRVTRLEESLADYLRLRRSLGHQLADPGRLLPRFVAFLDSQGLSTVTVAAAVEWATTPTTDPRSSVGPRRMTAVRGFARYLVGVDPATEVPPRGLLPQPTRWQGPFIFSPADIEVIMNRAASFTPPLRSATYVTLIGLLAATGLRIGEAIKLDRADIDWSTGVLLIRESKFGKSRLVPVTDDDAAGAGRLRRSPRPDPAATPAAELLRLPHPAATVLRRCLPDFPSCH